MTNELVTNAVVASAELGPAVAPVLAWLGSDRHWWYRAARPISEHIGELIATLMACSPDPEAALAYAMATRQRSPTEQP